MQEKIYNYAFIHIPKNAGTSVKTTLIDTEILYCNHNVDPKQLDNSLKQIIILRDPIDRFCSAVYYTLQFYSNGNLIQELIKNNINTPEVWANCWFDNDHPNHQQLMGEICNLNEKHIIGDKITKHKWHYSEQTLWVDRPSYVLIYDNLVSEYKYFFQEQLKLTTDLSHHNRTNKIDTKLSSKNIDKIVSHYKVDYDMYIRYKQKDIEDRLNIA